MLAKVPSIPAGAATEAALKMPMMVISFSRYSRYGFVSIFEHRPAKSRSLASATRQVSSIPKRGLYIGYGKEPRVPHRDQVYPPTTLPVTRLSGAPHLYCEMWDGKLWLQALFPRLAVFSKRPEGMITTGS